MKTIFDNCVILFGGSSEERLVSAASAQNLSSKIPEAQLIFLSKDGKGFEVSTSELAGHENAFTKEFSPKNKPLFDSLSKGISTFKNKKVILALHGTEGEDGTLQKLFEEHGISFTGSNSKASAQAFDKLATKKVASANGMTVAGDLAVKDFSTDEVEALKAFQVKWGKMVLKPLANGSSVGLYIVSTQQELFESIKEIKKKGLSHYLAEAFLVGREITVGVWEKSPGNLIALPCSEVKVIQGRQFDYEGKYLGSGVQELTPAPISEAETKACQDIALKIHKLIGCKGYTRTDMILGDKGPVLLEINTLPGLSKASFVPQQLAVINVTLREFFEKQLAL